jgi:N-carbamoyl-L-amino-acid hydrolase
VRAFLEFHIEQGPVLEHAGKRIGIVTAVAAPTRLHVTLTGEQNHSGTTPMNLRRDALAAAAEIILAVERTSSSVSESNVVATVGVIQNEPNVMNVIPGKVELRIDIRSADAAAKRNCVAAIRTALDEIAARRGIGIEVETLTDESPIVFSDMVISAFERAAARQHLDTMHLASGAGHDAAHIARVVPAGMVFIPSRGGVSHDPREYSSPDDIVLGTQVLLGALWELDNLPD